MALVHLDPFDEGATAFARRYTVYDNTAATFRTAGELTGTYCLHAGSSGFLRFRRTVTLTDTANVYVGFKMRAYSPLAAEAVLTLYNSSAQSTLFLEAFPVSGGRYFFRIRVGNKIILVTKTYAASEWHRFELYVNSQNSATGIIEWRVNAVSETRITGVSTCYQSNPAINAFDFSLRGNSGGDYVEIDDLIILDGSGTELNTFLGDKIVATMIPSRLGTALTAGGWTGGIADIDDQATGTVDNDSTYIVGAGAGGLGFLFGLSDCPFARNSAASVMRVYADARLESGSNEALLVHLALAGTFTLQGTLPVLSTSYALGYIDLPRTKGGKYWSKEQLQTEEILFMNFSGNTKRVTRAFCEVILDPPAIVTPTDLGDLQPLYFPIDWSRGTQVETSWPGDVTSSKEQGREDRLAYFSRPTRSTICRSLGLNKKNTTAHLQSSIRRGLTPSIGLLHSDRTRLTATASSGQPVLQCDTRYRRFFLGQRIMIARPNLTDATLATVEIGFIESMTDTTITLQDNLANSFAARSFVYPTMEVEEHLQQDVTLLSDEHVELTYTSLEKTDGETLPACWTSDKISFFPIRPQDGVPIFNPQINWGSDVTLSVSRRGDRQVSGKGVVLDVDGQEPTHVFTASFDSLSRSKWWQLACFFDSRKANNRWFWFINPNDTLTVFNSGIDYIDIAPIGNIEDAESLLKFVAFDLRDGTDPVILTMSSFSDFGSYWRVFFSDGQPTTPLTAVAKVSSAYQARFGQSYVSEQWLNEEMCQVRLEVRSVGSTTGQGVTNFATPVYSAAAPADIPDLALWLDAQKNCFEDDNVAGVLRRSAPFPEQFCFVKRWFDARLQLSSTLTYEESPRVYLTDASTGGTTNRPYAARFYHQWYNQGKRCIIQGPFKFSPIVDSIATVSDKELWDNTLGMTIVVVCIGGDRSAFSSDQYGIRYVVGGQESFSWKFYRHSDNKGVVQFYTTPGVVNPAHTLVHDSFETGLPTIWVLRWLPGGAAQVFKNGYPTIPAAIGSTPSSMPSVVTYDDINWLQYMQISEPAARGVADRIYRKKPTLQSLIAYKRQLSHAEINAIGNYMANSFGVPWTNLP